MTGVLIGDEQGLGKTVQALTVCEAANLWPIVVIAPSTARVNWQRELKQWLPHRTSHIVYGTDTQTIIPPVDALIFGWDTIWAWVETLDTPKALIIDEAQYAKSGGARRTQAVLRLADRCYDINSPVISLTGTPILNRASEWVAQLRLLNRLQEFGGATKVRKDFGNSELLPTLNRAIRAKCYVRRRKIDVMKDLPPKRYVSVTLPVDPEAMTEYHKAEADIVAYLAEVAKQAAIDSGATNENARQAASEAALRAIAGQQLVAITALRQLAVKVKLPAVDTWIKDFKNSGEKLVVFCWHRQIVEMLSDRFSNGLKIYGGMNDLDKQNAIDTFQTNPTQQALVCSIKAAGVAITLTAASNVVFVEHGWNPADEDQAADRTHRIGQTDSVTVYSLNAQGTIDEDMTELIDSKRQVVNAATDGDPTTEPTQSILSDLVVRLAAKGTQSTNLTLNASNVRT